MADIIRKSLAELVGTYIFVLFGPGSVVAFIAAFNQTLNPSTLFYLAITFGLGISVGIMAVANISGGHVNPAVTIAMFFAGRFPGKYVFQYIIAQLIGAVMASATVGLLFGYNVANSVQFGATIPGIRGPWVAFAGEFIMTFFFLWTIMGVTSRTNNTAIIAIVIGIYVSIMIFMLATISGGSINPARSFGPAVLSGILLKGQYYQWIYWIAPVLGGILGALSYKFMYKERGKIHYSPDQPISS
ncbi:MIP/aquaporin family protein [Cuniculiplasma divulgatum]|jgi:MIP family channel proteins|uniref:MIP family aquaporin n=1 Tax=Cuniculiplasma divulgatum TaxID=1673428 RepID=A0A1N5VS75_9ARCH|nr:aquaporin [Cuniculiplasma divulgatum]EQB69456.1 MAG: aquaporin [Thermoplasmatales archaeon Gpl]MCI2412541.1 aquaporin [Cuniculiplasma sp.]WMT49602.1 MAG: aquaporin [Thermoplasmatales archaeon]SIM75195.1 MIP family aquaporin [Cuniculiplasma divulgatum]SJK85262.1 MIP family aquaporin [Cuniculiplasma divulgatum]